jgi:hypothetical protein
LPSRPVRIFAKAATWLVRAARSGQRAARAAAWPVPGLAGRLVIQLVTWRLDGGGLGRRGGEAEGGEVAADGLAAAGVAGPG